MENKPKYATWRSLVVLEVVTLALAGLSAFLTRNSMNVYERIVLPPFAPPSRAFPVAWSILYPLMAFGAWLFFRAELLNRVPGLALYFGQLLVNVVWPLIFFLQEAFGLAFVWLLLLIVLAVWTAARFYHASKGAGWCFVPYLLWLLFALLLNYFIAKLN